MRPNCTFAGGAKEQHSQPIYCVAWSDDLHTVKETIVTEEEEDPSDQKHDDDDGNDDGNDNDGNDTKGDVNKAKSSGNENDNGNQQEQQQQRPRRQVTKRTTRTKLVRYMATCGSNHLTLYEVDEERQNFKMKKSSFSSSSLSSSASSSNYSNSNSNNNNSNYNSANSGNNSNIPNNNNGFNINNSGLRARQAYVDVDTDEIFYTCVFVGRGKGSIHGYGSTHTDLSQGPITVETQTQGHNDNTNTNTGTNINTANDRKRKRSLPQKISNNTIHHYSNFDTNDGPQLCCVAGTRGIIKIIDTVQTSLLLTLSGHGNEIYDMSICPTDPWLLLSASKDESLRLWNVKNAQCLAIFAGHEGHRDGVLSTDWHPLGKKFVSSGMDETIKIWSLEGETIRNAIKADREGDEAFRTVYQQLPIFSTSLIHANYVDCVQFVGDLVLSKSTSNTIALWKPDLSSTISINDQNDKMTTTKSSPTTSLSTSLSTNPRKCHEKFLHLCDFDCQDCDVWYVRFGTDRKCKVLVIGNKNGDLRIFQIDTMKYYNLPNNYCNAIVRHVSFSPDDKSIVVVCDNSTVWKWNIEIK